MITNINEFRNNLNKNVNIPKVNESDDYFCNECGEKSDGETCPMCGGNDFSNEPNDLTTNENSRSLPEGMVPALTDLDEPRPNRMKRPEMAQYNEYSGTGGNGVYIQDEASDIAKDKYGRERGERVWNGSIGQGARGGAMFAMADNIMKEKIWLANKLNIEMRNYWDVSYFSLWKAWMEQIGQTYTLPSTETETETTEETETTRHRSNNANVSMFSDTSETPEDTPEPAQSRRIDVDTPEGLPNAIAGTKDIERIENMQIRADGDRDRMLRLAGQMANSIRDVRKAVARGKAAAQAGLNDIASIFYRRGHVLLGTNESNTKLKNNINNMITTINEFKKNINEIYDNFNVCIIFTNDVDDNDIKELFIDLNIGDYNKTEKTLYIWDTTDPDMDDVYDILDDNFEEEQYTVIDDRSDINEKKTMVIEARDTTDTEQKVMKYLNDLRDSGITNMFGATPYIVKTFPELDKKEASRILVLWMSNFREDANYSTIQKESKITSDYLTILENESYDELNEDESLYHDISWDTLETEMEEWFKNAPKSALKDHSTFKNTFNKMKEEILKYKMLD